MTFSSKQNFRHARRLDEGIWATFDTGSSAHHQGTKKPKKQVKQSEQDNLWCHQRSKIKYLDKIKRSWSVKMSVVSRYLSSQRVLSSCNANPELGILGGEGGNQSSFLLSFPPFSSLSSSSKTTASGCPSPSHPKNWRNSKKEEHNGPKNSTKRQKNPNLNKMQLTVRSAVFFHLHSRKNWNRIQVVICQSIPRSEKTPEKLK